MHAEKIIMLETIWAIFTLAATIWVIYDVMTQNTKISGTMKIIWVVLALFTSILGAAAYYFIGRK